MINEETEKMKETVLNSAEWLSYSLMIMSFLVIMFNTLWMKIVNFAVVMGFVIGVQLLKKSNKRRLQRIKDGKKEQ